MYDSTLYIRYKLFNFLERYVDIVPNFSLFEEIMEQKLWCSWKFLATTWLRIL